MKPLLPLALSLVCLSACRQAEQPVGDYPIESVSLTQIELTDSFWLPKIRTLQQKTIRYAFEKCESEGRMANFVAAERKMAGDTTVKTRGFCPFDDTDLYKTIEGAAYSLVSAPNPGLSAYLDSVIAIIARGQEPDGYLTTWRTINPKLPPALWVHTNGERWNGLGMSHELYNSGHLFEAAAAHFLATGKRNFLDIALRNANLLVKVFGDSAKCDVPGHQIVETGLIKLYRITGTKDYLQLAKKFLDLRGDSTHREIRGAYSQDHKPVTEQDEVVGHAVRAVYMYAGMTDIAALDHDEAYRRAVMALWNNMTAMKMYVTGGLGARHSGESFGNNYELPNLTAYNETCSAIGGVYWADRLFRLTGDARFYDILERMLYNAVLPGISLSGTEFFYPNPLEADGKYAFNQGACTRSAWFNCSCCPTNLIRFLPSMPNLIYATEADTVFVNLFAANNAQIALDKGMLGVVQSTRYPWDGKISIELKPEDVEAFTLRIRIPEWAQGKFDSPLYRYINASGEAVALSINGEPAEITLRRGYAEITRKWKSGDRVELQLPMQPLIIAADPKVTDDKGKYAVQRGPIVYCMEECDQPAGAFDQPVKSVFTVQWQPELLGGVNTLSSEPYLLIPYYAWSNRGVGKMKVWMN